MHKRCLTLGVLVVLVAACTTFEVMIETPAPPDVVAISTLASLMLRGTQYAEILSERGITPEPPLPAPVTGLISGKVCYPGASTPALIAYFLDTITGKLIDVQIDEFQEQYRVELLPGDYFVYAWVPQYLVGGLYSQKVLCGNSPECNDHSPVIVSLKAGTTMENIDLCDWGLPAESLPVPQGVQLPGAGGLVPPRE